MKKNNFKLILISLLLFSMLFVLVGCIEPLKDEKNITLYLKNGDNVQCVTLKTTAENLDDFIIENNKKLNVVFAEGQYGKYITDIADWKVDSTKEFVSILLSFQELEGDLRVFTDPTSAYDYEYIAPNGAECHSSNYGVSQIPLVDGATYVLVKLPF